MSIHLEIGSGDNPQPGYVHMERFMGACGSCLPDIIGDACRIPFINGCLDSVLMFGVFEHFGFFEICGVVLEVFRALKPGGTFKFDVPDFDWFVERYIRPELRTGGRDEEWILKSIFGGQDGPGMKHCWGWNEERLFRFLTDKIFGFSSVSLIGRQWRDPEPNHLIWECIK